MKQQAEIVPVKLLGPAQFTSPVDLSTVEGNGVGNFVSEDSYVRHRIEIKMDSTDENDLLSERVGPREKLFFDPADTRVAMARNNGVVLPVVARDDGSRFLGRLTRADIYQHVRTQLDDLREHLVLEHKARTAIEHEDTVHQLVIGVSAGKAERIQRLIVPIQAMGKSLREADFRRQFGVQVIGIEQADGSIQCPPDIEASLRTN